ncbi:unnamed protein product [Anisakis simplex]|uniref:Phosphate ABC transporter permease n=1 Tax=Anisakis simplex TaxID=6269 RepID=A0A0M3K3M3_ANISI|nr:unnamed protein product [Anisakis simplex]
MGTRFTLASLPFLRSRQSLDDLTITFRFVRVSLVDLVENASIERTLSSGDSHFWMIAFGVVAVILSRLFIALTEEVQRRSGF